MATTLYPALVLDALKNVRYAGNGKNIVEAGMVADDIAIDGNKLSFSIVFPRPNDPFMKSLLKAAETAIHTYIDRDIEVTVNAILPQPQAAPYVNPLPGVKNIVGVSSGKGGVGKSTVAANLAVALAREGYKVGLLDADIFGPSVPKMFGCEGAELYIHDVDGQPRIIPIERYGVKLLSIGFVIDPNKAALWRGAMATSALKQLISEGDWGELDYFIIDMPPGTSDIHLTLVQMLDITGVVVVSTPQEVALADARKGIAMFREEKINVPVLGIVENMAWFTPERHPDERYYIFGREGAVKLSQEMGVKLLAQLPITEAIVEHSDDGRPIALGDTMAAQAFLHLAHEVVEAVEHRNHTLPPTKHVELKH